MHRGRQFGRGLLEQVQHPEHPVRRARARIRA